MMTPFVFFTLAMSTQAPSLTHIDFKGIDVKARATQISGFSRRATGYRSGSYYFIMNQQDTDAFCDKVMDRMQQEVINVMLKYNFVNEYAAGCVPSGTGSAVVSNFIFEAADPSQEADILSFIDYLKTVNIYDILFPVYKGLEWRDSGVLWIERDDAVIFKTSLPSNVLKNYSEVIVLTKAEGAAMRSKSFADTKAHFQTLLPANLYNTFVSTVEKVDLVRTDHTPTFVADDGTVIKSQVSRGWFRECLNDLTPCP
jgi:hypothetical protein